MNNIYLMLRSSVTFIYEAIRVSKDKLKKFIILIYLLCYKPVIMFYSGNWRNRSHFFIMVWLMVITIGQVTPQSSVSASFDMATDLIGEAWLRAVNAWQAVHPKGTPLPYGLKGEVGPTQTVEFGYCRRAFADASSLIQEIYNLQCAHVFSKSTPPDLGSYHQVLSKIDRAFSLGQRRENDVLFDAYVIYAACFYEAMNRGVGSSSFFSANMGFSALYGLEQPWIRSVGDRIPGLRESLGRLTPENARRWRGADIAFGGTADLGGQPHTLEPHTSAQCNEFARELAEAQENMVSRLRSFEGETIEKFLKCGTALEARQ